MYTVKSIGVLSLAKIMGGTYAALGLVFLPVFLIAGLVGAVSGGKFGALGGVGMVFLAILFPILYGAMGFVAGLISGLIYNLFAGWLGGIELQLEPPALTQPLVG